MKKLLICAFSAFCFLAMTHTLHARGGGGCLKQGTLVRTPTGTIAVEQLKPGDSVIGVSKGSFVRAVVQSVGAVKPEVYLRIIVNGKMDLFVTPEHPVEVSFGVFRMASALKAGDTVIIDGQKRTTSGTVTSVERVPTQAPAYNLLVSPSGNYVANKVIVHNKGCFLPETLIRKPDGSEVPLSRIKRHDRVLAFYLDGRMTSAKVRGVITYDVDEYRIVRAGNRVLQVTSEHPFYTGNGTFKTLETLRIGDNIFMFDGSNFIKQRITSIETVANRTRAYNLQTDAPNTYVANGAAVHNKGGGCFPAGTMIMTPDGILPIERISAGEVITAIDDNNQPVAVRVIETYSTQSPLLTVKTDRMSLQTTTEHPLASSSGGFRPAGNLAEQDEILIWQDGKVQTTRVTGTHASKNTETVYNLTVDWPHTFVADGFIVHNKGGGGGSHGGSFRSSGSRSSSSSSGSSGGSAEIFFVAFFSIGLTVILIVIIITRLKYRRENLDYLYSPSDILRKSGKTMKLLEFIEKHDLSMAPDALKKIAETTFRKLQECWQAREYAPMKQLLMPDLYQTHLLQIQGMVRNHEINLLAGLKIDRIDLVNVRYTIREDQREFTALITATATDSYIDDRTKEKLRGDDTPAQFQEFWTFQFVNRSWLLREIEQSAESDALKQDNFIEQFTDKGLEQVYGDTARQQGPSGPWLERGIEAKETRIERMLNFLVKTDRLWDKSAMLLVARNTFIKVTAAWESGDPAKIPADVLFPDLAANLKNEIMKNRSAGITLEFRNLCVRKVELVLLNNFSNNSKDEFVIRVRAHAQKTAKRNNTLMRKDDDVTAFEQYLTFGRLDNQWKLQEILNTDRAHQLINQENRDQESSPQQVRWYYQHKRAL